MGLTMFHKGKTYCFDTAEEIYIFALCIELDNEKKLQTDITTFFEFVNICYETDCRNAPLKPFAIFIADWWNELHNKDKQFIVNKFYEIRNL